MDDMIDLDIKRIALSILRSSWMILLAFLLGYIITYFAVEMPKTPMYTATALMYVSDLSDDAPNAQPYSSNQASAQALINTCGVIVRTNSGLTKIMDDLDKSDGTADKIYVSPTTGNSYTEASIKGLIGLSSVNGTEIMEIRVTCTDTNDAIAIADAVADAVPLVIKDTVSSGYATKIDSAHYYGTSNTPGLTTPFLVGVVAAMSVVAVIFLINALDKRIHTKEDIVSVYHIPVMGEIPDITEKANERYCARYESNPEKK